MTRKPYPLFRAWLRRSIYGPRTGYDFGFYFAPWPREEQHEGMQCRALVMMVGTIRPHGSPRMQWFWYFDDPARRPLTCQPN